MNLNDCNIKIMEQHWKFTPNLPFEGMWNKEFRNKKYVNDQCCSNTD